MAAAAPVTLLVEPTTATMDGLSDAMGLIYRMISERDRLGLATGKEDVDFHSRTKASALDREADGIRREREAQDEADRASHGFWATVGKIASEVGPYVAVVASVAAAVVTFGAASPAAAAVIALSVAGTVVQKTNCLGDQVSPWVGAGAQLIASVATLNGGAVVRVIQGAASLTSGTGAAANGVVSLEVSDARADEATAHGDALAARQRVQRQERLIADVLEMLGSVHESNQRALSSLEGAVATHNQTMTAASAGARA